MGQVWLDVLMKNFALKACNNKVGIDYLNEEYVCIS